MEASHKYYKSYIIIRHNTRLLLSLAWERATPLLPVLNPNLVHSTYRRLNHSSHEDADDWESLSPRFCHQDSSVTNIQGRQYPPGHQRQHGLSPPCSIPVPKPSNQKKADPLHYSLFWQTPTVAPLPWHSILWTPHSNLHTGNSIAIHYIIYLFITSPPMCWFWR